MISTTISPPSGRAYAVLCLLGGLLITAAARAELLVASYQSNEVLAHDEHSGSFVRRMIPRPVAAAKADVVGLALSPEGTLYVGRFASRKIERYAPDGTKIGDFATGLSGPIDQLLFGPDRMLYVSMRSGQGGGVHRFDPSKTYSGDNLFVANKNTPQGITFDPSGDLYVSESAANRIRKYVGPGKPEAGRDLGVFADVGAIGVRGICNLTSDRQGNIYVAGFDTNNIGRFDKLGQGTVFAADSKLSSPFGVGFGPDNVLYVSAAGSGNIVRCDRTGRATILVDGKGTSLRHPCQFVFTSTVTEAGPPAKLRAVDDGLVFAGKDSDLRVHFVGNAKTGYEVVFEKHIDKRWQPLASFPEGHAWTVCTDWQDSWYAKPHHVKVQKVASFGKGFAVATASAAIAGEPWDGIIEDLRAKGYGRAADYLAGKAADYFPWQFRDVYSLRHGMIKIERTWQYLGESMLGKISLLNRVRLARGENPRMLIPGSIYNGNPSAVVPGPQLDYQPGTVGLYEEHRLPVPMVNVESRVGGRRLYGSLVTMPSKIDQGNKGIDHWWSLGVQYGSGYVDLLSVSGPVATNGMKSKLYGHRNGFDPYDDAYLNLTGPTTLKKTWYLDLGTGVRTGYAFRETLWKAYDVFQPVTTPSMPFGEAAELNIEYTKSTFLRRKSGAAGFGFFPTSPHFQYAWCGGNLMIAHALLYHGARTGDQQATEQALETMRFFVSNAQAPAEGLLFGDFDDNRGKWVPGTFHGRDPGIASRQFGEILERIADLVILGRKLNIEEARQWEKVLQKGCDFLMQSPRHKGLFPRAWNPDGSALGWEKGKTPDPSTISTAGAFCIAPLARCAQITGQKKYLDEAERTLQAYYKEFCMDLTTPPWGTTLDCGGIDVEAFTIMIRAALDVYEATNNKRYLAWARDAADLDLTLMYFYHLWFPPESPLRGMIDTVGWTLIGTQNQEIDCYGYYIAPELYRLGQLLGDERYQKLGKVIFDAKTQTISSPGRTLDLPLGCQGEHFNHSNCTYAPGGRWRGAIYSAGIGWVRGSALMAQIKLHEMDPKVFPWRTMKDKNK